MPYCDKYGEFFVIVLKKKSLLEIGDGQAEKQDPLKATRWMLCIMNNASTCAE